MGLKELFPPSIFPYEDLTLVKQSGEKVDKPISACVHKTIEIDDMSLDIDEGDYLIRTLPNNKQEILLITSRDFIHQLEDIPAHYSISYKKVKDMHETPQTGTISNHGNTISINAPNAEKIVLGSIDNSRSNDTYNSNTVNNNVTIFEQLRNVASGLSDSEIIINDINEMEKAQSTPSYKDKYLSFIQHAANHMTVFAPFMAVLSSFL